MEWERLLMKKHAEIVTKNGGDILEIGFGMGISSQYIQEYGCNTHTIIEVNPQILEKLYFWAKDKPNVIILEGDWFEKSEQLNKNLYDGIFYDADCYRMTRFREVIVDKVLNENGIFTYFDPKGNDRYHYGSRLELVSTTIDVKIPKNNYHNDKKCYCPYFIN